jgi:hypothetical protein
MRQQLRKVAEVAEVEEQSVLVCQTGAPSKRLSHGLRKLRSNQCWFAEQARRAKDSAKKNPKGLKFDSCQPKTQVSKSA